MIWRTLLAVSFALSVVTCGSDDGGEGEGEGEGEVSLDSIVDSLENPTGNVSSAEDAQGVAAAYAELQAASFGGERRYGASGSQDCSQACSAGGSCNVSYDGSNGTFEYDNCCYVADCCFSGNGWYLVASGGAYSYCWAYDWSGSCYGSSYDGSWSYCMDSTGASWYVVEYNSETYAVSGTYSSTSGGTWTISASNGTWECTSDGTTGSCTDGTDTYTW